MFTGLIQSLGEIERLENLEGGLRLFVRSAGSGLGSLQRGDSISVNGCCLTVVNSDPSEVLEFEVSPETLGCTSLGSLQLGSRVNLESCVRPQTPMGGHFVTGHVDALGEIVSIENFGHFTRVTIRLPTDFSRLVVSKGSIAVDGVSLTVNEILPEDQISLMIIPHTWKETIFSQYRLGSRVNLEFDILAKYVESMLMRTGTQKGIPNAFVRPHS